MKKLLNSVPVFLIAAFFLCRVPVFPQEKQIDTEALKKEAPRIFISSGPYDIDYIRTEITFVNYVRDRKEAQIHILITTLNTGSGGREYTIAFIGQGKFKGIDDTQKFYSEQTDTKDEIRQGLVKALKIGLMSYAAKTPISRRLKISYKSRTKPAATKDKWNYWVFQARTSGHLDGEKSYNSRSLNVSFSANRVTPEAKVTMSLSADHNRQIFNYSDESIKSTRESMNFQGLFVKSLNDHWSAGIFLRAASSTYENVRFSISPAPAVEYNVFPYSKSTRKQLRFLYRVGLNLVRYREETIYEKIRENLWSEALSVTLSLKEKWGSVSTSLSGSHYFHDFSKNRLTFFNSLNLRLVKGLSVFAFGGGSRVHDQLSLIKGETSLEEVLLRRRQLETSYNYFFSIGFSFTFGSIYTNVVNPRFGSSGYGGISIIID